MIPIQIFKHLFLHSILIVMTLCLYPSLNLFANNHYQAPKRILAIFSYKQGLPFAFHIEQSLRKNLVSQSSHSFILDVEYTDQSRFPDQIYRNKIIDLYRYKYHQQKIDLVIAFGNETSDLMSEYAIDLFGDIPLILVTDQLKDSSKYLLKENWLLTYWGIDVKKTSMIIQQLLPDRKNLFIITGQSLTDQKFKAITQKSLSQLNDPFTTHYLDDLSLEELLLKVSQLPDNAVILFLSFLRDIKGHSFVAKDILGQISQRANAPIFGILKPYIKYNIVGGNLLSADYQGKKFATLAKNILIGKSPKTLNLIDSDHQILFNKQALKNWSINMDKLPPDSIILDQDNSIWSTYKQEVVVAISSILILIFILLTLIIQEGRRRQAEQALQKLRDERNHISQLLSMGEIAASLAHELNQPLSAIRTYAQNTQRFLIKKPIPESDIKQALNGIIMGNRHAEEILTRIRMALKKEPFEQKPVSVKNMIYNTLMLLQNKIEQHNILIKQNIDFHLPPILGDNVQLQQVLCNLIINAIESMTKGIHRQNTIIISAQLEGVRAVKLSVQDNGKGISTQEQDSDLLFDAFYTTKTEGMGMGLSISRSIIEEHGGRLWANLNLTRGTIFSFTIPIA